MSIPSNPDLLIAAWLDEEAREGAPERLIDVTRRELERTNQRRVVWPAWRHTPMTTRIAVVAAAIVFAVGAGYLLLPGSNGPGTPSPSPSASPTPVTTPAATPRQAVQGSLTAGTYWMKPIGGTAQNLQIDFTVPDGWEAFSNWALLSPRTTAAPSGSGIGFLRTSGGLFSDPCHWDMSGTGSTAVGDVPVGPTAADLATALASQTAYTSTAPVDTTLAGYSGKQMDIQLPSDVEFATCDEGSYWVWSDGDSGGSNIYAQGPGERRRLWILDVEGTRLVIFRNFYAGTTAADLAEAQAIIESIVITP